MATPKNINWIALGNPRNSDNDHFYNMFMRAHKKTIGDFFRVQAKDGDVTIEAIEPETIYKPITFKNGADSWVEKAFKPL